MSRRFGRLATLVLVCGAPACAYREIRYELSAQAPPPGGGDTQTAQVVEKDRNRPLRPEQIKWRFSGVLAAAGPPGAYTASGPGAGTVQAEFMTPAGTRALAVDLLVPGSSDH